MNLKNNERKRIGETPKKQAPVHDSKHILLT